MSRQDNPGLQPERTALAWSRTAFALMANAVLVLRAGMHGHKQLIAAGAGLAVLAAVLFLVSRFRRRQLIEGATTPARSLMVLTAATVMLATAAGAAALLGESNKSAFPIDRSKGSAI